MNEKKKQICLLHKKHISIIEVKEQVWLPDVNYVCHNVKAFTNTNMTAKQGILRLIFSRTEPILCLEDKLLPVDSMASSGLWKIFS